jgi:uncharacterized protein (TIGR02145 family)
MIISGTFTDSRDGGNDYKWVKIGNQIWMAENLNYDAPGSKCYDNEPTNCITYGKLYDWATAMNGSESSATNPSSIQGVCPTGWHLPSDDEWQTLVDFAGGDAYAGGKLKAVSMGGTDDYGFSALPGGRGRSGSDFSNVGSRGYWWSWSASEDGAYAYSRDMNSHGATVYEGRGKTDLYSVRCVKD